MICQDILLPPFFTQQPFKKNVKSDLVTPHVFIPKQVCEKVCKFLKKKEKKKKRDCVDFILSSPSYLDKTLNKEERQGCNVTASHNQNTKIY